MQIKIQPKIIWWGSAAWEKGNQGSNTIAGLQVKRLAATSLALTWCPPKAIPHLDFYVSLEQQRNIVWSTTIPSPSPPLIWLFLLPCSMAKLLILYQYNHLKDFLLHSKWNPQIQKNNPVPIFERGVMIKAQMSLHNENDNHKRGAQNASWQS